VGRHARRSVGRNACRRAGRKVEGTREGPKHGQRPHTRRSAAVNVAPSDFYVTRDRCLPQHNWQAVKIDLPACAPAHLASNRLHRPPRRRPRTTEELESMEIPGNQ